MLNLIQPNYAQSNLVESGGSLTHGQREENSSDGGFPALLNLASRERPAVSGTADDSSFREHPSAKQSSESSPNHQAIEGPSKDGPCKGNSPEDRLSGDKKLAGHSALHAASSGQGQKKGLKSEKQPSDPAEPTQRVKPVLTVSAALVVIQAASPSIPVPSSAGSTSGSTTAGGPPTGVASAQVSELAKSPTEAAGGGLRGKLRFANATDVAVGNAPREHQQTVFPPNPDAASTGDSWDSVEEGGLRNVKDTESASSSEARLRQKKSADVYATRSVMQATIPVPEASAQDLSPGVFSSNPEPSQATDASSAYSAPDSVVARSVTPDFQTTGNAVVVSATDSSLADPQIAARVAASSNATGNLALSLSSGPKTKLPAPVARMQSEKAPDAQGSAPRNAVQVSAAASAKSANPSSTDLNHPTSKFAALMQNNSGSRIAGNVPVERSANSSIAPNSESERDHPAHSNSDEHASKLGKDNIDSAKKELEHQVLTEQGSANQSLANPRLTNEASTIKDTAGKDSGKNLSRRFTNKALNDKDANDKALNDKDPNSKAPQSPSANSAMANGSLSAGVSQAASATAGSSATGFPVDALSAPAVIMPQPATNSSLGSSTTSTTPPSAHVNQNAVIPQNAASGNVQLARIADHAGQSEMHIGMHMPAFGSVEVHTSIHQSEVGITVGSEHGDLKAFLNAEIPALRDSLNQQNLQFSQLNFMGSANSGGNPFSGEDRGNSQEFIYKPNFTAPGFHSEFPAISDGAGFEGELFPAGQKGLSIHA